VVSSRALIERIRRELGSIHEKIVAHRYLAAIETSDLIYFDLDFSMSRIPSTTVFKARLIRFGSGFLKGPLAG
jgi:hypothetical protein